MSEEMQAHLIKASAQRAAVMGFIASLLEQDDLTLTEIQTNVCGMLSTLIDLDVMVGDEIDSRVMQSAQNYIHQEIAVMQANGIINNL